MEHAGLTRISACVLDTAGLLQVRANDEHFPGVLEPVPESLAVGETLHVRMQVPELGDDGEPSGATSVDLTGTLALIEGGDGPIALSDGLVFELDVSRVSRAGAQESVLPRPPEPLFLRAVQELEAEDEADRAAAARDEPFESPINPVPAGWHDEGQQTSNESPTPRRRAEAMFEATEPSGIVGTLKEMTLPEVVQSLEFGAKTAEIRVKPKDGKSGVVFLERGQVVYARSGTLTGDDAFFLLADELRGAFLIKFHSAAPSRNIFMPTGYLLLEVVRRRDEAARDLAEPPRPRPPAELPAPPVAAQDDDDVEETSAVVAAPPPTASEELLTPATLDDGLHPDADAVEAASDEASADEFVGDTVVETSPAPSEGDVDMPATQPEGFRVAVSADFEALIDNALDGAAEAASGLDAEVEADAAADADDAGELPAVAAEAADIDDEPTYAVPRPVSTPSLSLLGATVEEDDEAADVDLDDEDEDIISVEALPFPQPAETSPSLVFSGFFQEASAEGIETAYSASGEGVADDEPDPTFSSLAVALRGLRASDEVDELDDDDTAVATYRPVNTSDSFGSFG